MGRASCCRATEQRPAPAATDENSIAGKMRSLNDTLSLGIFFNKDFAL
jgi:hypothetical protein